MNKKNIFFSFGLALFLSAGMQAQVAINSQYFGQNAWYIDVTKTLAQDFSAAFDLRLDDIAASGVKFVRIGGIDPNFIPLYTWNAGSLTITTSTHVERLKHLIDSIRYHNMEPIIQVGYNPICPTLSPFLTLTPAQQATIAGNLVNYLNNTVYPSNHIKNWIISNEPDGPSSNCSAPNGGYGYTGASPNLSTHAGNIATYIKAFSTEMKNKDTSITIIGPELATFGNDTVWQGNKLMNALITIPATSIMGQISGGVANGKYYVDVISFHYYPKCTTRTAVIADPTAAADGFKNKLSSSGSNYRGLLEMINNSSPARTPANLQIAITEFNLLKDSVNDESDLAANGGYSKMIKSYGFRSFAGGQWLAEVLCLGMEPYKYNSGTGVNDPWMKCMNLWSVQERGSDSINNPCKDGLGYISLCGTTPFNKRPTYWHYKMVADNFKGNYLPNILGNSGNYKAFAYKNSTANEIGVLIMNQLGGATPTKTKTFKITFHTGTAPTGANMLFQFNAGNYTIGTGGIYDCTITVETTMLLVFDATTGAIKRKQTYSILDALRTSDTGTMTNISTQALYNSYTDPMPNLSDITIGTTITATNNKIFTATNSIKLIGIGV